MKARYRLDGGTTDALPGETLLTNYKGPVYGTDQTANKTAFIDSLNNSPGFYPGDLVPGQNEYQTKGQEGRVNAAGIYADNNTKSMDFYRAQLDPNSEQNQMLSRQAGNQAASSFYGAGTPGSARGGYAAAAASRDAVLQNQNNAQMNLDKSAENVFKAPEVVGAVGTEQWNMDKLKIEADKVKWDYAVMAPQEKFKYLQNLYLAESGLNQIEDGGGGGGGAWEAFEKFASVLGPLLSTGSSQGGPVGHLALGGMALGGPEQQPSEGIVAQGGMPQTNPMMGGMAPPEMTGGIAGMAPPPIPPMNPVAALEDDSAPLAIMEMFEEPMSELDMLEDEIMNTIAMSGGNITVTRKQTKRRSKT